MFILRIENRKLIGSDDQEVRVFFFHSISDGLRLCANLWRFFETEPSLCVKKEQQILHCCSAETLKPLHVQRDTVWIVMVNLPPIRQRFAPSLHQAKTKMARNYQVCSLVSSLITSRVYLLCFTQPSPMHRIASSFHCTPSDCTPTALVPAPLTRYESASRGVVSMLWRVSSQINFFFFSDWYGWEWIWIICSVDWLKPNRLPLSFSSCALVVMEKTGFHFVRVLSMLWRPAC